MKYDLFRTLPQALARGKCVFKEDTIKFLPDEDNVIRFDFLLSEEVKSKAKFLALSFLCDMDGAVLLDVDYFKKGSRKRDFNMNYQMIPTRKVMLFADFSYLDSHAFFIQTLPGMLKGTCAGLPTGIGEIEKITVTVYSPHASYFTDFTVFDAFFTDEEAKLSAEGEPMVDPFGQWISAEFPGKTRSEAEMTEFLRAELKLSEEGRGYPEGFSKYGGALSLKFDTTGYFHTAKRKGRWYLVDPDGYGFFSNGICYGSRMGVHGFVDGMRSMFSWLPEEDDPEFKDAWTEALNIPEFVKRNGAEAGKRKMFNFARANMIRAFGPDKWWDAWCKINASRIKSWGYNTINVGVNNYEDENVFEYLEKAEIPFVWTLKHFPLTQKRIYRDFPDVFSPEYRERAAAFAKTELSPFLKNPYMIGYFITNEPEWRFQDVNLAERVFASKEPLVSKKRLISWLFEKYTKIETLNEKWGSNYTNFEDLLKAAPGVFEKYPGAKEDLNLLHELLVNEYEAVVHEELKKADPDHLDLGMRYSQAGASVMGGCHNHDLFSFNCYFESPSASLQGSAKIADMPMIIGEWQFGCTNNGKLIGGLLFARTQENRGMAIANYMQDAMTDKNCVGLAYFEYNDQPLLGRFDGECMQHGLIDVCNRPYEKTISFIRETGLHMYEFTEGIREKDRYPAEVFDRNNHNEMF